MKLNSRALKPRENGNNAESIELNRQKEELLKRIRRPKRVIIEEEDEDEEGGEEEEKDNDSSSEDEDDVPLFQRKAIKNQKKVVPPVKKKVKLSNEEQIVSVKIKVGQSDKKKQQQQQQQSDKAAKSEVKSATPNKVPQATQYVKSFKAPAPLSRPPTSSLNEFKAPAPPTSPKPSKNESKATAPLPTKEFKAPMPPPSSNGFKAPILLSSSNGFKAPIPPSLSNGFKAPMLPASGSKPMDDGFKAPFAATPSVATDNFKAPIPIFSEQQQHDLMSSRLAHYMTSICGDLDKYNQDKIKVSDSLLTFRDDDDLPTLDISVMKKFTTLITNTNRHNKNLDSVDMVQFGKIIKLMENTIIVSTDMDIIEHYVKNTKEDKKEITIKMLNQISDALDTCCMIFELLTTCKLDKKFLSRNLITNCLHFIKNQLDYTIYPLIDINAYEDDATSLVSDARIFLTLISTLPKEKRLVSTFIPSIIRFFRRAFTLILTEDLDDDVLVIVAYISMAPFFHDYADMHNSILLVANNKETSNGDSASSFNPFEQLKLCALDILKHIFSRYPKHRRWVFEEILTSLGTLTTMDGKRRYRLKDNRSIHVISALFMQLVQCSASVNELSSHKNWFRKWNIKYQKVSKNKDVDQMIMLDDKLVRRATTAWRSGAEAAANCASFFLEFLMSKCKSRKADSYSLLEYRQILDNTLQDIMTVFNDPDWPVAELIMRVFSRILISLLEGNSSDVFLKSLAIEWLGTISCKIKTGYNKLSGGYKTYTPEWIYELNETLPIQIKMDTPASTIALLDQCRKKILDNATEERVNPNIIQFYLCNWGFIESVLWTKANKGWEIEEKKPKSKTTTSAENKKDEDQEKQRQQQQQQEDDDEDLDGDNTMMDSESATTDNDVVMEEKWPKETAILLGETCKYYWLSCIGIKHNFPKSSAGNYNFPEMSRSDYILLMELLASRQTLYTSFNFILSEILTCLEKDAILYRTKALRAIGKIAAEVPEIMEESRIRNSVVQRVHDGSPSVRDAAVEMIAKYLGRLETVPIKLYEIVRGRIMDTAMNVRKRLVKLLRDLYFKFYDPEIKIDIASKLILRIGDNEITISQLALKVTQEILFMPFKEIEKEGNDYFGYSYAHSPKERKRKITVLTKMITGAVSKLDPSIAAQNVALSQIIQKTVEGADEKSLLWYDKVFQWIVDSLFDRMAQLDEEDKEGNSAEFINCLATVYSFAKSCPNLLDRTHISALESHLVVCSSRDWSKVRYVLTIYRDVLPRMKIHDDAFIQQVERELLQLMTKCPLDIIPSGVSCLCTIVERISFRYNVLIKMLGSCITKLRQVRQLITDGVDLSNGAFGGVLKMITILGILCQHFEFDKKRQEEPTEMDALNLVYRGEISILVFDLLQFFTSDMMDELNEEGITLRMTALQGLGYFFASYPTFMISETSTILMDKIFEQGTFQLKTQLMRVFQEFLGAEEKRIEKKEETAVASNLLFTKEIDVDTLLGNTAEYAELGVNGSLMQRYLKKILKCALSTSDELRYTSFEVVSTIVHQGLAHPVLCMPAIVAAETSPDVILRTKAYYLHRYAHDKYGSLLYSRLPEYIATSFDYQKIICNGGIIQGHGKRGGDSKVDPVLGLAYSVLKDKKKAKFDFLGALVKPFAFDLKTSNPEDIDIDYLRYLAENIITLDLCNTEEVLHVVYIMDRNFITLGADLLSYVRFLKKQGVVVPLNADDEVATDEHADNNQDTLDHDLIVAAKLSVVLCILLYVKKLLVELYDIPDDEIREFNPNTKKKARDVTKDMEMDGFIDWNQLLYFKYGSKLSKQTASDACLKFEYLIMSDTTAVVVQEEDVLDD